MHHYNYNKLIFEDNSSANFVNDTTENQIERDVFVQRPIELNGNSLKSVSIDAEYETIVMALKKANYNKSKAAKILNVDRKTLYNKMRQYKEFNEG